MYSVCFHPIKGSQAVTVSILSRALISASTFKSLCTISHLCQNMAVQAVAASCLGRIPSRKEMRMLLFFSDGEPVLLAAAGTSAGTVSYWGVGGRALKSQAES